MGAPPLEGLGNCLDDLAVEIEPEVVARGEVGEPLFADPDHPSIDLVDDGIRHRIGPLELGQLAAGRKPAVDPTRRSVGRPVANRPIRAHGHNHRLSGPWALAVFAGICGPAPRPMTGPIWGGPCRRARSPFGQMPSGTIR